MDASIYLILSLLGMNLGGDAPLRVEKPRESNDCIITRTFEGFQLNLFSRQGPAFWPEITPGSIQWAYLKCLQDFIKNVDRDFELCRVKIQSRDAYGDDLGEDKEEDGETDGGDLLIFRSFGEDLMLLLEKLRDPEYGIERSEQHKHIVGEVASSLAARVMGCLIEELQEFFIAQFSARSRDHHKISGECEKLTHRILTQYAVMIDEFRVIAVADYHYQALSREQMFERIRRTRETLQKETSKFFNHMRFQLRFLEHSAHAAQTQEYKWHLENYEYAMTEYMQNTVKNLEAAYWVSANVDQLYEEKAWVFMRDFYKKFLPLTYIDGHLDGAASAFPEDRYESLKSMERIYKNGVRRVVKVKKKIVGENEKLVVESLIRS